MELNYRIDTFNDFYDVLEKSLVVISKSVDLLFPIQTRDYLIEVCDEFLSDSLEQKSSDSHSYSRDAGVHNIDDFRDITNEWANGDEFIKAGLSGAQLNFKFAEINLSANRFYNEGGQGNLLGLLKKSVILLKSIVGVIPILGSALQEFIDFVIERLKDLTATG